MQSLPPGIQRDIDELETRMQREKNHRRSIIRWTLYVIAWECLSVVLSWIAIQPDGSFIANLAFGAIVLPSMIGLIIYGLIRSIPWMDKKMKL